jgi:N-acetylgalactosamine-N,N'-diacetylbacillosaminyl-diphospho-undecaprenol 4-alpha-N-acetylgalactosaminyltransferase
LLDREPGAYSVPDWVDVIQLDCGGKLVRSILALRGLYARLLPDVTLSFLTRANVANVAATRAMRTRCIISERVNTSAHFSSPIGSILSKLILRLSYPRSDHIVAVSQGVAQDLAHNFGVRDKSISIISNPVDHESIRALADEAPSVSIAGEYVAATGRLVPNKNFAMLIEAFARSGLPGSLVILGEGPERARLEALIAELGMEGRVHLPGFVENPFAMLKRASIFALPSNAEGFPNGLVEAMACGLPVVATNCASGPSEILLNSAREDLHGLVRCDAGAVVPTDDTQTFAEALRIVHDPGTRLSRGRAASGIAGRFNIAETAHRYWEIIDRAAVNIRQRRASPPAGVTAPGGAA